MNTFIKFLVRVNDDDSTVNCNSVTGAIVLVIKVLDGTPKPMGRVVEGLDECQSVI